MRMKPIVLPDLELFKKESMENEVLAFKLDNSFITFNSNIGREMAEEDQRQGEKVTDACLVLMESEGNLTSFMLTQDQREELIAWLIIE